MKINEQLYLVVPLERDDGRVYAHVHILPISVAMFDVHFQLLIRAYQLMVDSGRLAFRSAKRFVRTAAAEIVGQGGSPDLFFLPLQNEIERLSTVVVAAGETWETLPLQQAIAHNRLEPGDGDEAVNAAFFFTASWHVPPRRVRSALIEVGTNLWGAHTSSSPPMAPAGGSPISTETANTGGTLLFQASPPIQSSPSVTVIVPGRRAS